MKAFQLFQLARVSAVCVCVFITSVCIALSCLCLAQTEMEAGLLKEAAILHKSITYRYIINHILKIFVRIRVKSKHKQSHGSMFHNQQRYTYLIIGSSTYTLNMNLYSEKLFNKHKPRKTLTRVAASVMNIPFCLPR